MFEMHWQWKQCLAVCGHYSCAQMAKEEYERFAIVLIAVNTVFMATA